MKQGERKIALSCAVYTRVSTESGLEQDFNSLDNQREASEALISRGHLYWILSNPIYIGRLRRKGQAHDGLHPGIVEIEIWVQVQQRLASQAQPRRPPQPDDHSFLVGKLYDDRGNRMGASHASKCGRRWRYYVSRAALTGAGRTPDRSSAFQRQSSRTGLPTQSGPISRRGPTRSTAVISTAATDVATTRSRGMKLAAHGGTYRARTMCETRSTAPRSAPRGSRLF